MNSRIALEPMRHIVLILVFNCAHSGARAYLDTLSHHHHLCTLGHHVSPRRIKSYMKGETLAFSSRNQPILLAPLVLRFFRNHVLQSRSHCYCVPRPARLSESLGTCDI